jgi:hypothetical protein
LSGYEQAVNVLVETRVHGKGAATKCIIGNIKRNRCPEVDMFRKHGSAILGKTKPSGLEKCPEIPAEEEAEDWKDLGDTTRRMETAITEEETSKRALLSARDLYSVIHAEIGPEERDSKSSKQGDRIEPGIKGCLG